MKKVTIEIKSEINQTKLYIPPKSKETSSKRDGHCYSFDCTSIIGCTSIIDCTKCLISTRYSEYLAKYLHGEYCSVSEDETGKFVIFEETVKKEIELFVPLMSKSDEIKICSMASYTMDCDEIRDCTKCLYNYKEYVIKYLESTLK